MLKNHSIKLRICVGICMLALGFVGVVITDLKKDGAWEYWRALSIVYGLISLLLSGILRAKNWTQSLFTIWHEIAHWTSLVAAIYIASYFVKMGLLGRYEASLVCLLLLSLATFLAGVYIEPTLFVIGLALGAFTLALAFLDTYLYTLILPGIILIALILLFSLHRKVAQRKRREGK